MTYAETLFKQAAEKFCDKVDAGLARSVETYTDLRQALVELATVEQAQPWRIYLDASDATLTLEETHELVRALERHAETMPDADPLTVWHDYKRTVGGTFYLATEARRLLAMRAATRLAVLERIRRDYPALEQQS